MHAAWQSLSNPDLDSMGEDERDKARADQADALTIAQPGTEQEQELLSSTEAVIASWFDMERVNNFTPHPIDLGDGVVVDGREFHAIAEVAGVTLHGYIDRLDRYTLPDGRVRYTVSDYKTGKVPGAGKRYSQWTMDKIRGEYFFQLRVYALLMWEMHQVPVNSLRLIFVKSGDREQGIWTMDVDRAVIESTRAQVRSLWRNIQKSARTGDWPTHVGPLCDWCYFKDICPAVATADDNVNGLLPERATG
jgi:putative RecB family exonuclease